MTGHPQRQFRARMSGLDEALAFAEAFVTANGIAPGDALRLSLIIEELFTNTVEHGHGGGSDSLVGLALAADDTRVWLDYEDAAAAFDPVQWLAATAGGADAPPDEARVGGLGLRLVARLAASMAYTREDGRNRLRLVLVRRVPGRCPKE